MKNGVKKYKPRVIMARVRYVDFCPKICLILYPTLGNLVTQIAIMPGSKADLRKLVCTTMMETVRSNPFKMKLPHPCFSAKTSTTFQRWNEFFKHPIEQLERHSFINLHLYEQKQFVNSWNYGLNCSQETCFQLQFQTTIMSRSSHIFIFWFLVDSYQWLIHCID